jgi:CRP-like cAMP-binding protein
MPRFHRARAGQTGNRLLDKISAADFKPLAPALEAVRLSSRQVLYRADDALDHLFFPVTAVLSLAGSPSSESGQGIEIMTVGNEGMAGITALLGVPIGLFRMTCQAPGDCFRLPVPVLEQAMSGHPSVDALVKRYMATAFATTAQAVICNALHSAQQRVCRWLLDAHEKTAGDFPATHEYLAAALGVKRPTVSVVATTLQRAGFIAYHRGTIRILQRERLEQLACDCYRVTKAWHEGTP